MSRTTHDARMRFLLTGLLAVALAAGTLSPAAAYPRPGATELVSVRADGTAGAGLASGPAMSADGSVVAFASMSSNLVAGDTNGTWDVFVADRRTDTLERVSVATDGAQGNGPSTNPTISADGRLVAFESYASTLAEGVTNARTDIFVHDRDTGETSRVSVATDGTEADGDSSQPSLSADGRLVVFQSTASNLVAGGTPNAIEVLVHDRQEGTTELVSVRADGTHGDASSRDPVINASGTTVAFTSTATNLLVREDVTNGVADVYVAELVSGDLFRVSIASDGAEADAASSQPSISANGRLVAFASEASNLVPSDTNASRDVFVHDRNRGVTTRVSVAASGAESTGRAGAPMISGDGRFVTFTSRADDLGDDVTNETDDVYVHDRKLLLTERVSLTHLGEQANGASSDPAVSHDGATVAFSSAATDLVDTHPTTASVDVYLRHRGPAVGVMELSAARTGTDVEVSGLATLSGTVRWDADDAPDDGAPGARELGGELTGAALIQRVEHEDLLFRWDLAHIPDLPAGAGAGAPGVMYRFHYRLPGTSYVVEATSAGVNGAPMFELRECGTAVPFIPEVCTSVATLSGGIGTVGDMVTVAVPFDAPASGTRSLSPGRVETQLGDAPTSRTSSIALPPHRLDSLTFGASVIAPRVELGVAQAGTPVDEVDFDHAADLTEGAFSATLDVADLDGGAHELWARACVGSDCGLTVRPLP